MRLALDIFGVHAGIPASMRRALGCTAASAHPRGCQYDLRLPVPVQLGVDRRRHRAL
jgi:hypothetical protein